MESHTRLEIAKKREELRKRMSKIIRHKTDLFELYTKHRLQQIVDDRYNQVLRPSINFSLLPDDKRRQCRREVEKFLIDLTDSEALAGVTLDKALMCGDIFGGHFVELLSEKVWK